MAQRQVRGGVSQSLRQRVRGARIDWVLPRLLQSPPAALEPWRHHTRSRLLPPAAPPHGSLTPADAPLIDAERLFKQPGPPLCLPPPEGQTGDRLFLVQLYRWFPSVLKAITIVRPETLVRWHRACFRRYWRWKSGAGQLNDGCHSGCVDDSAYPSKGPSQHAP